MFVRSHLPFTAMELYMGPWKVLEMLPLEKELEVAKNERDLAYKQFLRQDLPPPDKRRAFATYDATRKNAQLYELAINRRNDLRKTKGHTLLDEIRDRSAASSSANSDSTSSNSSDSSSSFDSSSSDSSDDSSNDDDVKVAVAPRPELEEADPPIVDNAPTQEDQDSSSSSSSSDSDDSSSDSDTSSSDYESSSSDSDTSSSESDDQPPPPSKSQEKLSFEDKFERDIREKAIAAGLDPNFIQFKRNVNTFSIRYSHR